MENTNFEKNQQIFKPNCIFCSIYLKEKEKLVHETANTFSFFDRDKGGCYAHLLVCPKRHIKNVNTIEKGDLSLILEMKQVGLELAQMYGKGKEARLGFHRPPFYSIKHLHMHVCVGPIKGIYANYVKFGLNLKRIDSVVQDLQPR